MPPLAGFFKFSLFHAMLAAAPEGVPATTWGLDRADDPAGLASDHRADAPGVRTFWAAGAVTPPPLQFSEAVPVGRW